MFCFCESSVAGDHMPHIVATLGRYVGLVREALDQLARLARSPLAGLAPARREAVTMDCGREAALRLRP